MTKNQSYLALLVVVLAIVCVLIEQADCGWSDKSIRDREKMKTRSLLGIWSRVGKREYNPDVNPNKFWLRFGKRSDDYGLPKSKQDALYDMEDGEYFLF